MTELNVQGPLDGVVPAGNLRETEYGIEFEAEVLDSRPLTPTCHGIRVTRHPEFSYEPVQYTYLSLRTPGEDEPYEDYRPMSLASSPTRDYLAYGVRLSESAWKQAFQALEPGDQVLVEGPQGEFVLDPSRPAIFVAGGIGITPLKGMAEYATDRELDIPVRLLYTNRTQEEIAYRDHLKKLAQTNPSFEITHTLTRELPGSSWDGQQGRIDEAMLASVSQGLQDPVYYVCGSPSLVQDVQGMLVDMGVATGDVRYEKFWGYD